VLPEFEGRPGVEGVDGNEILEVEFVVFHATPIHRVRKLQEAFTFPKEVVALSICVSRDRCAIASEVFALVSARGGHERVHDVLVLDKILADLDELFERIAVNIDADVEAHADTPLQLRPDTR